MAIELPLNYQKYAETNTGRRVALVHLYQNASDYMAFATHAIQIGTTQYLACVSDAGAPSSEWKLMQDNGVTLAAPTIVLNEYTTPDSYSLIEQFQVFQFAGQRIQVYLGFDAGSSADNNLLDFICIFDGMVDDPKVDGRTIELPCILKEIPTVEIAGRKIDQPAGKIGTFDATGAGIVIPKDADALRLPMPFGHQWNSPLVCYDRQTDCETNWATFDNDWGPTGLIDNTLGRLRSVYRHNLNQTSKRVLLEQENMLVPFHALNYNGETAFSEIYDTRILSLQAVRIADTTAAPATTQYDDSLFVEVPLRLTLTSVGSGTNVTSNDATANLYYIFDGDQTSSWQFNGTLSAGAGASSFYWDLTARIYVERNLRHDHQCIVHPSRPIHIPTSEDEWTVLWLGEYKMDAEPTAGYNVRAIITLTASVINPAQTAGISFMERNGTAQPHLYQYFSKLFETGVTTEHVFDPSTDLVNLGAANYLSDAGNQGGTQAENELPFLRREALDMIVEMAVRMAVAKSGTYPLSQSVGMRVRDVSYHAFESVSLDYGKPIYAEMQGTQVLDCATNLLSRSPGATGVYELKFPAQYAETIFRGKGGAATTDFQTEDYNTHTYTKFYSLFGNQRDYSGLVATGDLTLDKWLRDYVKDDGFTIYRDTTNLWRFLIWQQTLGLIQSYNAIHSVNFADCDQGFEVGLTPLENVCAEIRSMETDYIHFSEDYAQKWHWKLSQSDYDFAFWRSSNTEDDNQFFREKVQKRYTSCPTIPAASARVTYSSVAYGCIRTNKNKQPDTNPDYWQPLAGENSTDWGGSPAAWSSSTVYYGDDSENRVLASFLLNQYANRHRTVKFGSSKMEMAKFEVGDVLQFVEVPRSCLGMVIKGWAGEEDVTAVDVNGQDAYYVFIVTKIQKRLTGTVVECMQMHDLTAYPIYTGGVNSVS